MNRLFDETFVSEENNIVSRNIWYGYIDLYTEGEYGKDIILDDTVTKFICERIKSDVSENLTPKPTEINWYLYGKTETVDAIGDKIRPTIMIRNRQDKFLVRCNISDHDFALQIDNVLSFETRLEKLLKDNEPI